MSGQLRNLKSRIRSVENTKKITRAMEMVAAAKLRRFQDMMVKARPFTEGLENLLKRLAMAKLTRMHPYMEARDEKKRALLLITSDAGLCGSYNNDLIELARGFLREHKVETMIGVGKSGMTALKRRGFSCQYFFSDLRASRVEQVLSELRGTLEKIYLSKEVDSVYVVYSHFRTITSYQPVIEKLLPLEKPAAANAPEQEVRYIFEPSPEILFQKLVPLFFEAKVRTLFLESIVSEQIARMRSMHQATQNAKEMIDSLVLLRNKARQAAITKEIIEIVSGSRALKLK